MNKITEVTRRDIVDIIRQGFIIKKEIYVKNAVFPEQYENKTIFMRYWGRLDEIEFLSRLYNLENMRSSDSRYSNAYGDIYQHTVNNDDWDYCWVFTDGRFNLMSGNDDMYLLKFLCEMLHPVVRIEDENWQEYNKKFNELLRPDGYELYEKDHISGRKIFGFREIDNIEIPILPDKKYVDIKYIGEGSYAKVYKYKDEFYDKFFAIKRAKKDLDPKEVERFKREFEQMKGLSSPYIMEVYSFDEQKLEYTMEYMDETLEKYIKNNNANISITERKNIISQIINGYKYLHSKGMYHRDVSFKNVLLKKYENINVYKISDFGLVKIPDSDLTSLNSEIKGSLNDPSIKIKGFERYDLLDEIYALTQLLVFVMTGKTNLASITQTLINDFIKKGMNSDRNLRFQTLDELKQNAYDCLQKDLL